MLEIGNKAPDFTLYATPDQQLKLSELKGKKVVIAFYPADWSPVCGDQMALYNEMLSFFRKYNAELIGVSVDSKWCHLAFTQDRKLHFPLLADYEPKGSVSKAYGIYDEVEGHSQRAIFIVDEQGIIQWNYLSPVGLNPGADGIFEALKGLN
ncbi:redoxin domain-containing protein [Pedobacter sp.]|uniref:redoxin domain-containing protein n=1 Tax=Pedobacter sp. TaxID=1411316 RepID=UPI003C37CC5C